MREGAHEKELRELLYEQKSIPKQLTEIKRRGRKARSCQNSLRKSAARVERARRKCASLPKPWSSYAAHGKNHDLYARPEVTEIWQALRRKGSAEDMLRHTITRYETRYTDRAELRERFKMLPDLIDTARTMAEIAAKRKAVKTATVKDWKAKWLEVGPGLVIQANKLKAYIKTFGCPIPIDGDHSGFDSDSSSFVFYPTESRHTFLRLKCYTWQQAEYCRQ